MTARPAPPSRRRRAVVGVLLVLVLGLPGCGVARRADGVVPQVAPTTVPVPTVVAPPQAEGLDGSAGEAAPHACAAVAARAVAPARWTAKPYPWNDGGLPALDLCTLVADGRPVQIGVSALPAQPNSVERLANAADLFEPATALGPSATSLGPDARSGPNGVVFAAADHAVRITAIGFTPGELLTLAEATRTVVPTVIRNARQSDAACQLSNSRAEQFVGALVQLRRDYRVNGAITCIWGTYDATVSIVESYHPDSIPELRQPPSPRPAPIGRPGYYLPDRGELVFRQGRRVVRVTGLTDPPRVIPLDTLVDLVEPLMPLFVR